MIMSVLVLVSEKTSLGDADVFLNLSQAAKLK